MKLFKKREKLRNKIKEIWRSGITWTDKERAVSEELNAIHKQAIEVELLDDNKANERNGYSVCGWSERHGYFRNKRFLADNIKDAKIEFEIAKKETNWGIPTIIVKHSWLRSNSPAMVDFESDVNNLNFSDNQELVDKHMCGNKSYRWKELLNFCDNYTY